MSELSDTSIKLHNQVKSIKAHVIKLNEARSESEIAKAEYESEFAKECMKTKASEPKYSEASIKNHVLDLLSEKRLEAVKKESHFKGGIMKLKVLEMEFSALEIEANNLRAELKKFGG